MAVFSYLFFSFGIESWFSDKVRTAISESVEVADAYVKEHQQAIRADALGMAQALNQYAATMTISPQDLVQALTIQASMRGLTEAAVLDSKGTWSRGPGWSSPSASRMSAQMRLRRADQGEVVIMTDDQEERVRRARQPRRFSGLYLYVGRFLEPKVLAHRRETQLAAAQYAQLEGKRAGLQITFSVIFILVAMLLLAAAVAIGINFATQLADPISHLVGGRRKGRSGRFVRPSPRRVKKTTRWSCSAAPSTG